jgi:hypothetical protein
MTKAQHAPISGWPGLARQSARPAPFHTASMTRNLASGGTIQTISRIERMVRAMLSGPENRFFRIQPIAPASVSGGGSGANGAVRTNAGPVISFASVVVAMSLIVPRGPCGGCRGSSTPT